MAKTITAAQRKKISEDLTSRIRRRLNSEITELDYDYGYGDADRTLTTLQESILYSVAAHADRLVEEVLKDWEVSFERDENTKVAKLSQENKDLKRELKELRAIKTLIETARGEV